MLKQAKDNNSGQRNAKRSESCCIYYTYTEYIGAT